MKLSRHFLSMSKQEFTDILRRTRKMKVKDINNLYKKIHGHDLEDEGKVIEP